MIEDIKLMIEDYWRNRRGRAIGLVAGFLVGCSILIFGFFKTVFLLLCAGLGLYIGSQVENGGSEGLWEAIKRLPKKYQH